MCSYTTQLAAGLNNLELSISPKSVIVPSIPTTQAISRKLAAIGIFIKPTSHGVDLGIGTAAGTRRSAKKQNARIKSTKSRPTRISFLSKVNRKCGIPSITNAMPAQVYGHTVQGLSPVQLAKVRSNFTKCTSRQKGANPTPLISTFFSSGKYNSSPSDPAIAIPTAQVRSWIALWGRISRRTKFQVARVWAKIHKGLKSAKKR